MTPGRELNALGSMIEEGLSSFHDLKKIINEKKILIKDLSDELSMINVCIDALELVPDNKNKIEEQAVNLKKKFLTKQLSREKIICSACMHKIIIVARGILSNNNRLLDLGGTPPFYGDKKIFNELFRLSSKNLGSYIY